MGIGGWRDSDLHRHLGQLCIPGFDYCITIHDFRFSLHFAVVVVWCLTENYFAEALLCENL